ncbi:MATE family efflux transporter [Spiroplasma endosymbiont of Labia minor]|uniref:MATE family efflux transporter n=1 Tax=Spiroplasma endosymbiont of Labia minor TaxID=3066305 RepID=UPI0030CB5417
MFSCLKSAWSDKKFLKEVFKLMIPGVLQGFFIALGNLIVIFILGIITKDNATEIVAAVSLSAQLFSLCLFVVTGISVVGNIFAGQFIGQKNMDMVQQTTRWKVIMCVGVSFIFIILICAISPPRILSFLDGGGSGQTNTALLNKYGAQYTWISLPTYFLIAIIIPFIYTLNVNKKAHIALIFSTIAIFIDLICDVLLGICATNSIVPATMGKLNIDTAQAMAIGTNMGRITEFMIYVVYFLIKKPEYLFGKKWCYVSDYIWRKCCKTAALLVPGELLYQVYVIIQSIIIGHIGGDPGSRTDKNQTAVNLAGVNVVLTIMELFWSILQGFYIVVPIFISQYLGTDQIKKAKDNAKKIVGISIVLSFILGLVVISLSFWVPDIVFSNLDKNAKIIAKYYLIGVGINAMLYMLSFQIIVILRAGPGQLLPTLSDQLPFYLFWLPMLVILLLYTNLEVKWIMIIVCSTGIFQITTATLLFKYSNWAQNITNINMKNEKKKNIINN